MSDVETIKNALDRATKTVTLRPERGQRVYRNVATLTSGTQCAIEEAGQNLTLDVGQSLGGDNTGPTPSMVLRSAMSGCVAIGIKQWAARRDVPIDQLEVVLETDVDARGQLGVRNDIAPGFEGVRLSITVSSPASPELIDDVVRTSLQYSPLMDVFLNRQEVEHRLSVVNADMNVAAAGDR